MIINFGEFYREAQSEELIEVIGIEYDQLKSPCPRLIVRRKRDGAIIHHNYPSYLLRPLAAPAGNAPVKGSAIVNALEHAHSLLKEYQETGSLENPHVSVGIELIDRALLDCDLTTKAKGT